MSPEPQPPARVPADWPHRAQSRGLTAGGLDWHVQVMGTGPTVLLLHGSGASAHSWSGVMAHLAPHATVVAPDLPGHGYTEGARLEDLSLPSVARALQQLLAALALPAPSLVAGHSAGAALALRWTLSQATSPPRALVGFNPSLIAPPAVYTNLLGPLIAPLATSGPVASLMAVISERTGLVERLLRSTGSTLTAAQRAPYETLFKKPTHVQGAMGFMAAADLSSLLAAGVGLSVPCHFVLGDRDSWVPEKPLREVIAQHLPQARVATWSGGHLLHEVEPARAAALLRAALAPAATADTAPPPAKNQTETPR